MEMKTQCRDSGYSGADKQEELQQIAASFFIAARLSQMGAIRPWRTVIAKRRAKVEHPLRVIKRPFGYGPSHGIGSVQMPQRSWRLLIARRSTGCVHWADPDAPYRLKQPIALWIDRTHAGDKTRRQAQRVSYQPVVVVKSNRRLPWPYDGPFISATQGNRTAIAASKGRSTCLQASRSVGRPLQSSHCVSFPKNSDSGSVQYSGHFPRQHLV